MHFGIYSRTPVKIKAHTVSTSDTPRILCATDLSETSEQAVQRALLLARQLGAKLLLLHVVDESQLMQVIGLQADRARSRSPTASHADWVDGQSRCGHLRSRR